MTSDQELICEYLGIAAMHKSRSNDFGHGLFIGRALSHSEQNGIDPEWLVRQMHSLDLDAALVSVPKIEVGRG